MINLAELLRPKTLADFVGQEHVVGKGLALPLSIQNQNLHSMVFWGPPGSGKTTLAKIIAQQTDYNFIALSAVLDNLAKVREAVGFAKREQPKKTILFVDEVHRFNKSQQDAFLPHVENGTICFIGATTENPSFELNRALLSRLKVYVLKKLTNDNLLTILNKGWETLEKHFKQQVSLPSALRQHLIIHADGDARCLLNTLQLIYDQTVNDAVQEVDKIHLSRVLGHSPKAFDKQGEHWYNLISALHKSIRGSAPDAALYWYCRILAGGGDPLYVARRLLAIASEDVGNADVRALPLALAAWQTYERLGQYEGERAIAHACVYLACAPKSNAIDQALKKAKAFVSKSPSYPVPIHLRNAPTQLLRDQKYGSDYRYAHDEAEAYAAGESYFPEELKAVQFYHPTQHGLEQKIKIKLDYLKELDKKSQSKRYT